MQTVKTRTLWHVTNGNDYKLRIPCERNEKPRSKSYLIFNTSYFLRFIFIVDTITDVPIPRRLPTSTKAWPPFSFGHHHTVPYPPYSSLYLTPSNFFFCFSRWKKSSKGNDLLMWKRWKKMAEALKGNKIDKFKNCAEQWK